MCSQAKGSPTSSLLFSGLVKLFFKKLVSLSKVEQRKQVGKKNSSAKIALLRSNICIRPGHILCALVLTEAPCSATGLL